MRCLFVFIVLISSVCHAETEIIATIKPLQLIADAITEDVTEVGLLTSASVDPHELALKPSEMRRLTDAKLILWVGPDFDYYLSKSAEMLAKNSQLLAMSEFTDPLQNSHLWLDPAVARNYAASFRDQLVRLYPDRAELIEKNYSSFRDNLDHALHKIADRLAPLHDRPYLVYHDAYVHFERRFGLEALGVIEPNHMGPPGAKRLMQLRAQVKKHGVRCVIIESSHHPRAVSIIKPKSSFRVVEIDPLARKVERGRQGYINFLESVTKGFETCLI